MLPNRPWEIAGRAEPMVRIGERRLRLADIRSFQLSAHEERDFLPSLFNYSVYLMVAAVFLHMCRVFFTGSYKKPREFNWVIGVILFLLTLFLSFTGYLLPWDQLAFWAITVGASIAGYAPVVGADVKFLLLGDYSVGQEALLRFYVLHIAVLPLAVATLVMIHFWRIRKDGGLSRPPEADLPPAQPKDELAEWPRELEAASVAVPALQAATAGAGSDPLCTTAMWSAGTPRVISSSRVARETATYRLPR